MAFELRRNEELVSEAAANLKRGIEFVGGRLTITTQRLIFEAHALNIQQQAAEVLLSSIADIEPGSSMLGMLRNRLKVRTTSGIEYDFVVSRSDEIADLIQQLRDSIGSGGAVHPVPSESIASELSKLNELYQQGVITKKEFAVAKSRLLKE